MAIADHVARYLPPSTQREMPLGTTFGFVFATLVYASLFFREFRILLPAVNVSLVPTDVVVFFAILGSVGPVLRRREVTLPRHSVRFLGVAVVFLVYHLYLLTKSPQPVRGVSLILLLCRDIFLVGILAAFLERAQLHRLNRTIFRISVLVAVPMLVLFPLALVNYEALGFFKQTVLFIVKQSGTHVYRAQWFVSDPNFYGVTLLVGYLCGIAVYRRNPSKTTLGLLAVVSAACLVTLSRSVVGLLVGITGVRLFLALLGGYSVRERTREILGTSAGIILGGILIGTLAPGVLRHVGVFLVERLSAGGRLVLWSDLVTEMELNYLTGAGLRATEETLGRYSHNSYLAQLYNGGLISLGLYLSLLGSVILPVGRAWIRGKLGDREPYWWGMTALAPFLFFFSFAYQPLVWLVMGVLVATALEGNGDQWTFSLPGR